ncbi:hypothetical protein E4T39_00343 [Aureobasidium subglaciale]|nr:hypothetical protein E4T39_00343 [Aureobasidium subglaciale]
MDDLPAILISKIIDFAAENRPDFSKPRLSPYATISRSWQEIVEAKLFDCIRMNNDEVHNFAKVFNSASRQLVLRQLFLRVYSTTDTSKCWGALTISARVEETNANNETLTTSIRELFQSLMGWHKEAEVELYVLLQAYADRGRPSMRTRPRILEPDGLAMVECVEKFIFRSYAVTPTQTVIDLASRLPGVQHIDWLIKNEEARGRPDDVERVQNRVGELSTPSLFCKKKLLIDKLDLAALQILELSFAASTPPCHHNIIPSILLPFDQTDHLSQSIRHLSQNMQQVILDNMIISSQFFWPLEDEELESQWSQLEMFKVGINPMAAEGGWWMDGLPSLCKIWKRRNPTNTPAEIEKSDEKSAENEAEDTSKHNLWPSQKLEELLLVMAKAVSKMPNMRSFSAFVDLDVWVEDQRFGVWFVGAGERDTVVGVLFDDENDGEGDGKIDRKRLYWSAPRGWRMCDALKELWCTIMGDDGVVRYHEW